MSRKLHVSVFAKDDFRRQVEGKIVWQEEVKEVKEHWLFWRDNSSDQRFWTDENGFVFAHTSGPADNPASYRTRLTLELGGSGRLAHTPKTANVTEQGIDLRRVAVEVEEDITIDQAKALAQAGPIVVPASGGKVQVTVLPISVFTVPEFHPNTRAVAAITFGGARDDVQAVNMDVFLNNNYRREFHGLAEENDSATYREEERILVRATQARSRDESLPIHLVQDIGKAADALNRAKANERVVALICHGNSNQIGRFNPGFWLTEADLSGLRDAKRETGRIRRKLATAKERLAAARAAVPQDFSEVQAAEEEVESWKQQLPNDATNEILSAFEETALRLNNANVKVVELQACGTAAANDAIPTLGFLALLEEFLGVPVKGHPETIWCFLQNGKATLWLGEENDMGNDGTKTSSTSLPVPGR